MLYLRCERRKTKTAHTGPPGYKVVELLGPAASAGGTVRATGERSEVSGMPEGRPPGGQLRHNVTVEIPMLSLRAANHALCGASDESEMTKLAIKKRCRTKI